jgi:sensor domain CHASE-containing protein
MKLQSMLVALLLMAITLTGATCKKRNLQLEDQNDQIEQQADTEVDISDEQESPSEENTGSETE